MDHVTLYERALRYAERISDGSIKSNPYVKLQCDKFLKDLDQGVNGFLMDLKELEKIDNILKLVNFATGSRRGMCIRDGLHDFQAFILVNIFGWKGISDPEKRRFENIILMVARKNGKTFLCALIFLILMLLEGEFSEFYSVSLDRELASQVKKELQQIIAVSPLVEEHFKVRRTDIYCNITRSKYIPLASDSHRLDGRLVTGYIADECGAMKDYGVIQAMVSGMMNTKNRLGIKISTAYDVDNSVMLQEVDYVKKVLDGVVDDQKTFGMLYMVEEEHLWDDIGIAQANPLDIPENIEYIKDQRKIAQEVPAKQVNFLTKHLNWFMPENNSTSFMDVKDLKTQVISEYDWAGRDVWVGLDLAMSTDNCAVSILTMDHELGAYVSQSWAFVPADTIRDKERIEKVSYRTYEKSGYCFICGDRVVDYEFIEEFILNLESKLGVTILGVLYDKYNANSTVQKLKNNGLDCIETPQSFYVLSPACKLFKESVYNRAFYYMKNPLFEMNVANAKEITNAQMLTMVAKKVSTGKIDLLASLLNCFTVVGEVQKSVYEERELIIL